MLMENALCQVSKCFIFVAIPSHRISCHRLDILPPCDEEAIFLLISVRLALASFSESINQSSRAQNEAVNRKPEQLPVTYYPQHPGDGGIARNQCGCHSSQMR